MKPVPFLCKKDHITLGRFLKAINAVQSGGEVKTLLYIGAVMVNDVMETKRGRKLYNGDIVSILEKEWVIVAENPPE